MLILTGCQSDEKRAVKIHNILEESAQYEKEFVSKQNGLFETRKNAQLHYNELVSLDMNEVELITEKINAGVKYTEKQQELLKEAEDNFQSAYHLSLTIEKNIKKIKDEAQKNKASELITFINERKNLMDTFFKDYHENLALQAAFYEHLKNEEFNLETLDRQISDINKRNHDMGELIQKFNQYTEQYIEAEKDYYQINS